MVPLESGLVTSGSNAGTTLERLTISSMSSTNLLRPVRTAPDFFV